MLFSMKKVFNEITLGYLFSIGSNPELNSPPHWLNYFHVILMKKKVYTKIIVL